MIELITRTGVVHTFGLHLATSTTSLASPLQGKAFVQYPDAIWNSWRRAGFGREGYRYTTPLPDKMSVGEYLKRLQQHDALVDVGVLDERQVRMLRVLVRHLHESAHYKHVVYRAHVKPRYHALATETDPSTVNCHTFAEAWIHKPSVVMDMLRRRRCSRST